MDGIIVMGIGGPLPSGLEGLKGLLGDSKHLIEHMREHVEECRKGDYGEAACLVSWIKAGAVSLEDLDITEEELEQFRRPLVKEAEGYLAAVRNGDYEHLSELTGLWSSEIVGEQDLGITEEELKGFCKLADIEVGKEVIEECRQGDYRNLVVVMTGMDEDRFTPEDPGTSEQELGGFLFKRRMGPMVSGNGASPTSKSEPAEQRS